MSLAHVGGVREIDGEPRLGVPNGDLLIHDCTCQRIGWQRLVSRLDCVPVFEVWVVWLGLRENWS